MPIAHDIILNDETHTYTDTDGIEYTPVSKVLGRFKHPFDAEKISKRVSATTGRPTAEILAEWAGAAAYGTAVHQQLELFFLGLQSDTSLIEDYLPHLHHWRSTGAQFSPETILCLRELRIAGTADLLVNRGGEWSILDWKTNKAIYRNGFGNKKMKPPLDHLDDCNYYHYALQLSFYAVMLGQPINKLNLVHIPKGQGTLQIIRVPFLYREIMQILEILVNEQSQLCLAIL